MDVEDIASEIVDVAFQLHRHLGPGLLESAYELFFAKELERRGLQVERQKPVAVEYRETRVEAAFRVDLLVGGQVLVELKSVARLGEVHRKQVLTYLRFLNLHLGFLINFGELRLKNGLHRIVRDYRPSRPLRSWRPSRERKLRSLADRPDASAREDPPGESVPGHSVLSPI